MENSQEREPFLSKITARVLAVSNLSRVDFVIKMCEIFIICLWVPTVVWSLFYSDNFSAFLSLLFGCFLYVYFVFKNNPGTRLRKYAFLGATLFVPLLLSFLVSLAAFDGGVNIPMIIPLYGSLGMLSFAQILKVLRLSDRPVLFVLISVISFFGTFLTLAFINEAASFFYQKKLEKFIHITYDDLWMLLSIIAAWIASIFVSRKIRSGFFGSSLANTPSLVLFFSTLLPLFLTLWIALIVVDVLSSFSL